MMSRNSVAQIVPRDPSAELKLIVTAPSLQDECVFHSKQHEAVIQCNLTPLGEIQLHFINQH